MKNEDEAQRYIYLGDKQTDNNYKGKQCIAVKRSDGKCIRGKNGNMLVQFDNEKLVVLARLLRKIKKDSV